MSITYITGDVTSPVGDGPKIIPHIVNDIGAWGSGVVIAISKKWPDPERHYKDWYRTGENANHRPFELGEVDFVQVENDIVIANMIGQHNIGPKSSRVDGVAVIEQPIRYGALHRCMEQVRKEAVILSASIHAPKFGTLRAGGDWKIIERMINEIWFGLNVTIYEYKE